MAQSNFQIKREKPSNKLKILEISTEDLGSSLTLLGENYTQGLEKMHKAAELKYLVRDIDLDATGL